MPEETGHGITELCCCCFLDVFGLSDDAAAGAFLTGENVVGWSALILLRADGEGKLVSLLPTPFELLLLLLLPLLCAELNPLELEVRLPRPFSLGCCCWYLRLPLELVAVDGFFRPNLWSMEPLEADAEAVDARLLVDDAGLGMADLGGAREGDGQKVEEEGGTVGGRSWEAECWRGIPPPPIREVVGAWGKDDFLAGDGIEVEEAVRAGDGGTEGILGVALLNCCCCCCCCCCSCFCCCLNLDSWKNSPSMAFRFPSATSVARTSSTATPRADKKARHARTFASHCACVNLFPLTTPATLAPTAASMTSAKQTPSLSSVLRSRSLPCLLLLSLGSLSR